jgi:hypothetical protein
MPLERWLYACRARWQRLVRRHEADQALDDELDLHLQTETQQNLARGMSREDAERTARRRLGNPQRVREDARGVWSPQWIGDVTRDARIAARGLIKDRSFAAAALLTLALCIGANTAVFSVINAVIVKPLPYPDAESLVSVWHDAPGAPAIVYWPGWMRESVGTDLWVRPSVAFLVRSRRTGETGFLDEIRSVIWATNGSIALGQTRTLQDLAERSV